MLSVNKPEITAKPIGSALIIKLKIMALNTENIYQPLMGALIYGAIKHMIIPNNMHIKVLGMDMFFIIRINIAYYD